VRDTPNTRYARCGDLHIAYQVTGEGPIDLLLVPGWVSHVEFAWEDPLFAAFLRRLASFSRLILMDRRGCGLSDPVARLPTLEERMDDVRAVLDAAKSERTALFGISEGGPLCILFGATYPQRTRALILYGTFPSNARDDDYPWGLEPEALERFLDVIDSSWGTGITTRYFAPSIADQPGFVERWGRFERLALSPGSAKVMLRTALDGDVRHVLSAVTAPTLVLHRSGDRMVPVAAGRYIASRIPGARFVELPGPDHCPWVGDVERLSGEIEEFLTGTRGGQAHDRQLATILFTDIVEATGHVQRLGDRAWGELLGRFLERARVEIGRARGRVIDTAGDGILAAFDGPGRAVRCAGRLQVVAQSLGVVLRTGVHTGECELVDGKLGGIAVHVAARIAQAANPGEVLVSQTVRDLVVGSDLRFVDRGSHALKGVSEEWRLYAPTAS